MIITLTTDFGTEDGYVGAMKGRILSLYSQAQIVDLTHEINPQDIVEAAFSLERSIPEFPANTIHIAVVDPGVGSERNALLIETKSGWLIGPDNGVFELVLSKLEIIRVFSLKKNTIWWNAHTTFDGLALFAPAAALLAKGIKPEELGTEIKQMTPLRLPAYKERPMEVYFEILFFDHFGNAITNLPGNKVLEYRDKGWKFIFREYELPFMESYHQMDSNKLCCLMNSSGQLELAVKNGSAKKLFKLLKNEKLRLACDNPELTN